MHQDHENQCIGVLLGCCGSLLGVIGTSLARHSYVKTSAVYSARLRWIAGVSLSIFIGPIISGLSLLLCPASLVASFGAFSVLFNVFVACYVLDEKPTAFDLWGSLLVFLGIATLVLTSASQKLNDPFDVFLKRLFSRKAEFYVLFVVCLLFFCLSVLAFNRLTRKRETGVLGINPILELPLISRNAEENTLRDFSLAVSAGLCSSNITLSGKSIIFGVVSYYHKKNLFEVIEPENVENLFSWPILSCCGLLAVLGCLDLMILNLSLQHLEALYFVPLRNATIVICGNLGGMALFDDRHTHISSFCFGVFAIIAGMTSLANRKKETKELLDLRIPSTRAEDGAHLG